MDNNIMTLRAILKKAYDDWSADENQDHHCKSAEGAVSVTISYPTYFEDNYLGNGNCVVTVYSYVFGPNRNHSFEGESLEEASSKALNAVIGWLR